jgi:hypothetical protein
MSVIRKGAVKLDIHLLGTKKVRSQLQDGLHTPSVSYSLTSPEFYQLRNTSKTADHEHAIIRGKSDGEILVASGMPEFLYSTE